MSNITNNKPPSHATNDTKQGFVTEIELAVWQDDNDTNETERSSISSYLRENISSSVNINLLHNHKKPEIAAYSDTTDSKQGFNDLNPQFWTTKLDQILSRQEALQRSITEQSSVSSSTSSIDLKDVKECILGGADVNYRNSSGYNLLERAGKLQRYDVYDLMARSIYTTIT